MLTRLVAIVPVSIKLKVWHLLKGVLPRSVYFRMQEKRWPHLQGDNPDLLNKRSEMYARFVKKGDLVFDVGANVGNRISPLLNIGAQIIAIEPQKECADYLEYRFGKKITVLREGMGSRVEERVMHISNNNTVSSFSEDWISAVSKSRFAGIKWSKKAKIAINTLDNVIVKYGTPVFIKIDVEGFEAEVLKGLTKPVPFMSFEYTVPEQSAQLEAIILDLRRLSPDLRFNYSIDESMDLGLSDWLTINDFIEFVRTDEFLRTSFGDVYVRINTARL